MCETSLSRNFIAGDMLGAQPVFDAGSVQDENLGAAGGIGVMGNLQDKLGAAPVRPRTFFTGSTRGRASHAMSEKNEVRWLSQKRTLEDGAEMSALCQ